MNPCCVLIAVPPEVLCGIYFQLPAFRDVFALAATCRQLHTVWCDNQTSIYHAIAPSEIEFLDLARQLLADQGGSPTNSTTLTTHDVRRMVRNASKARNSAYTFGLEVAPRTPSFGHYHTPPRPDLMHPLGLSHTERSRFIRAYYRACSLLELGPSSWRQRYKSFTLRQLHRTSEMIHLDLPLGEEFWPNPPLVLPYSFARASESRGKLWLELEDFQQEKRREVHGPDVPDLHWVVEAVPQSRLGGVDGFLAIWDHFESEFHYQTVGLCKPGNTPRPYEEYMREVVWGDSSDEDAYRQKYRPPRKTRRQQ
ncbi:hypothetical protein F5Y08DRAFT_340204 [Xylaria arbuscula]|nr:hypothetical protein F5Y08DRAFT_340204 [Xylaria arbuscula]